MNIPHENIEPNIKRKINNNNDGGIMFAFNDNHIDNDGNSGLEKKRINIKERRA